MKAPPAQQAATRSDPAARPAWLVKGSPHQHVAAIRDVCACRQDTLKELMASEKLPAVGTHCRVPVRWADQPAGKAVSSLQAGPAAVRISQGNDAPPAAQQQPTVAGSERQAGSAPHAAQRPSVTAGADEEEGTADLLSRLAAVQGGAGRDKSGWGEAAAPAAAPQAEPVSKQTAVASSLAGAHAQAGTAPASATLSAGPSGSAASLPSKDIRAPVAGGSSPAAMQTGATPQQQAPPPVAAAPAEPSPRSGTTQLKAQQGLPSPQNGRSPLDVASIALQQAGSRSEAKLAPPRTGEHCNVGSQAAEDCSLSRLYLWQLAQHPLPPLMHWQPAGAHWPPSDVACRY